MKDQVFHGASPIYEVEAGLMPKLDLGRLSAREHFRLGHQRWIWMTSEKIEIFCFKTG